MLTRKSTLLTATSVLAACMLAGGAALAQTSTTINHGARVNTQVAPAHTTRTTTGTARAHKAPDAQNLVNEAVTVINNMKKDPQLVKLMEKSKGMFIVPEFGRGAFIIGGRGGAGLVVKHGAGGTWSDPAFYDIGGISIGAQVGGSGGAVAFLLMNQSAIDAFKSGNKFSLNAGAGLSIVTYSANSQASWGKGDIILWSNTKGAYVGATVSVTDVNWDDDNNRNYYGKKVDITNIFNGKAAAVNGQPRKLKSALPG